jgi:hypothetical protein
VIRATKAIRFGGTVGDAPAWVLAARLCALPFHGASRIVIVSVGALLVGLVVTSRPTYRDANANTTRTPPTLGLS